MQGKGIILLFLCALFMVGGCAVVKIEMDGQPVPNNVLRGRIPSTGMRVDSAFIRYFDQKEGDEFLDTFEYLDPYAENLVVSKKHLRSLVVSVHILNPRKETYLFLHYYEIPSDLTEDPIQTKELLYIGNLSRKEFNISLPIEDGKTYHSWYEMWNSKGHTIFIGPSVHYGVVGIPTDSDTHSRNSKKSGVAGLGLGDPVRSIGR